jgi:hypothetical protein
MKGRLNTVIREGQHTSLRTHNYCPARKVVFTVIFIEDFVVNRAAAHIYISLQRKLLHLSQCTMQLMYFFLLKRLKREEGTRTSKEHEC